MLASITPLGERGRHSRWGVTVSAFVLGAIGSGALLGAMLGALGSVGLRSASGHARLAMLAVALTSAIALELLSRKVPGPRRQVDERWLRRYRGWVYGVGFGAQLGVGVGTVVSTTATYVALAACLLIAHPAAGAVIGGVYGAGRGLQLLAGARVRTPEALWALHRRMEGARRLVRPAAVAVMAAALVATVVAL